MKKHFSLFLFFLCCLSLSTSLQALNNCQVSLKNGTEEGSLPWLTEQANLGQCDQILFTTLSAPLKINITEPLFFNGDHEVMVSGANYGLAEDLAPLGVVIDAR